MKYITCGRCPWPPPAPTACKCSGWSSRRSWSPLQKKEGGEELGIILSIVESWLFNFTDDWRRKLGSGLAQWFLMNKYPLEKLNIGLNILMKFWFLHCYIAIPTWKSLDTWSRGKWNQSMAKQIDYKQDNCSWTRSSLKEGQKMEILRSIRPSLNWFWQEGGESVPFSSQSFSLDASW